MEEKLLEGKLLEEKLLEGKLLEGKLLEEKFLIVKHSLSFPVLQIQISFRLPVLQILPVKFFF